MTSLETPGEYVNIRKRNYIIISKINSKKQDKGLIIESFKQIKGSENYEIFDFEY